MNSYPFTDEELWERYGKLRGSHNGSHFTSVKLKTNENQNGKAIHPIPKGSMGTIETRRSANGRVSWFLYFPTYSFFVLDKEVLERVVDDGKK